MACCDDIKVDIVACRVNIVSKDSVFSDCVSGYKLDEYCKVITFKICDGTTKEIDFQNVVNYNSWEELKEYVATQLAPCCASELFFDPDSELDFVSIETVYRCHKTTCEKVAIEKCKNRSGSIFYRLESDKSEANIDDYELCDKVDNKQDVKEYIIDILTGGSEQFLSVPDKYDNVMINNQSDCPVIAQLSINDKNNNEIIRNIKLKPFQQKTLDWKTDVINKITVGQCEDVTPSTGVTDVDSLFFIPANGDIQVLVTFFNS